MVTIRDVAKAAGVSLSTASHALAAVGGGAERARTLGVGEKTVKHVENVARTLGYLRNTAAASLRTGRTGLVGLLLTNPSILFYAELSTEIQTLLGKHSYAGIAGFWKSAPEADRAFEDIVARGVDGIITCHNVIPASSRGIPIVAYQGRDSLSIIESGADQLNTERETAFSAAIEQLAALGHKRIAMVYANRRLLAEKVRGACRRAHIPQPKWFEENSAYFYLEGSGEFSAELAAALMLPAERRPTALVCYNDTIAIRALALAGSLGLHVPRDLSIVGVDGTRLGGFMNPPLTSFGFSPREIAERLVDMMMARLSERGERTPPKRVVIPAPPIFRASHGPAPK